VTEAGVVNLFLVVRVLLVGGILIILPRITRKGLLFGTYVGEASADRDAARRLVSKWDIACVTLMVFSLLVGLGISLAGWPIPGGLTGTAILLLGGGGLYFPFHFRARQLAAPATAVQARRAAAPLLGGEPKGAGMAKFTLGICLLTALATFVYALVSYEAMSGKSFAAIMWAPSLNLALSPFYALNALLIATAKRSIRGGSGGRSVEAQNAFRAIMTSVFSWTALLSCAFMTVISVQIVRIGLAEIRSVGAVVGWTAALMVAILFGFLVRIMKGHGQGGALRETGTVETPLTNGIADNARWVLGIFYVDRDDPSIMVEERFGIGYTLNYGNRKAILILVSFLVLSLSLGAFLLIGTFM
jgi:uncharacterized membrane protein